MTGWPALNRVARLEAEAMDKLGLASPMPLMDPSLLVRMNDAGERAYRRAAHRVFNNLLMEGERRRAARWRESKR